jgi:hypothetical protein
LEHIGYHIHMRETQHRNASRSESFPLPFDFVCFIGR